MTGERLGRRPALSGGLPVLRAPVSGKSACPACHCAAPAWEDTGWDRIIELWGLLLSVSANPAVALHRAVAVGGGTARRPAVAPWTR